MPGLVGDRRDREHHVGGLGDLGRADLQADHERRGVRSRPRAASGSARSAGSTPPTTRPPILPAAAAARIASPSRPVAVGQGVDAPGRCRGRPAPRRRRPGGRRAAGWAGSRPRPRHGRPRGAGPRPAGHRWCRPGRAPRDERPGTVASRSPTRITPPASSGDLAVVGERVQRGGLVAGARCGSACRASCAGRAR